MEFNCEHIYIQINYQFFLGSNSETRGRAGYSVLIGPAQFAHELFFTQRKSAP